MHTNKEGFELRRSKIVNVMQMNDIKLSKLEWVSRVVSTPKKDAMLHFYVGYCTTNALTARD